MVVDPGSFRDPKAYVYFEAREPYRKINPSGLEDWRKLKASGLLDSLHEKGLLVPHQEVSPDCIKPDRIPFISYPQEWSFSQYKEAALLTLDITLEAVEKNFILKDASAYNVQFIGAHPIFIDTLSFEPYEVGSPWVAYKQFCQHFLGPLTLMSKVDVGLSKLMSTFIDGIPLPLVSKLLPKVSYFNLQLLLHIHLHARSQNKYSNLASEETDAETKASRAKLRKKQMSKTALLGLLDGLRSAVRGLTWNPAGTEWGDYYSGTNYSDEAMSAKATLVGEFVAMTNPKSVWDLGANTGVFSHVAAKNPAVEVVSFDIDPAAVEKHYRFVGKENRRTVLPLVLDLTAPTPSYGWANRERQSLEKRGPARYHHGLGVDSPFGDFE